MKHSETTKKLAKRKLILLPLGSAPVEEQSPTARVSAAVWEELSSIGDGQLSFPPPAALVQSWNPELWGEAAFVLAQRAKEDGCDAVITPDFCLSTSVYSRGVSEDPLFLGKLAAACVKGIAAAGVMPVLSGCSLTDAETEFMGEPSNDALRNSILKPFEIAVKANKDSKDKLAVLTSSEQPGGGYEDVNSALLSGLEKAINPQRALAAYDDNTIAFDDESDISLERDDERQEGFSDTKTKEVATLCARAWEESIVLLKNQANTLPLKPSARIAVIGTPDGAYEENSPPVLVQMLTDGEKPAFKFAGYAEGYAAEEERSDELIPEACSLAESADAVLLFLGFGRQRASEIFCTRQHSFPANRIALIHALRRVGKPIIAVISGEYAPDTSFDSACQALLLAPGFGKEASSALLKILCGKVNPSGKLARTLYQSPGKHFAELKRDLAVGRRKVGSFLGYRAYDTAGLMAKYPFGHGLSYTPFNYSRLKANDGGIKLRVTNTGRRGGYFCVQAYVGIKASALQRPRKELVGFVKKFLKPGRSALVKLPLSPRALAVWDANGRLRAERGVYTAYVGSSVQEIKLSKSFNLSGSIFNPSKETLADYIPERTNIPDGGYMLYEEKTGAKRSRPFLRAAAWLLALIALAYDVTYILSGSEYQPEYLPAYITINLALGLSITYLITSARRNKRLHTAQRARLSRRQNEVDLSGGQTPLEKLFLDEFAQEEQPQAETAEISSAETEEDFAEYIDKSLTAAAAAERLTAHMSSQGTVPAASSVRSVLAAMSACRILLVQGANNKAVKDEFLPRLCSHFGTSLFADSSAAYAPAVVSSSQQETPSGIDYNPNTSQQETPSGNAYNPNEIQTETPSGNDYNLNANPQETPNGNTYNLNSSRRENTYANPAANSDFAGAAGGIIGGTAAFYAAVSAARANSHLIYAAALSIRDLLSLGVPKEELPPHLWLWVIPAEGESSAQVLKQFSKNVVALTLGFQRREPAKQSLPIPAMNFHQFMRLVRVSEEEFFASETMWKKLDRLEEYINSRVPYRVGNRMWRQIERYVSACLACGSTEAEAIDCVVAAKLLPSAAVSLAAHPPSEDNGFAHAIEKTLGEDNAPESAAALRHYAPGGIL